MVKTRCIGKPLQGEMYLSISIDKIARLIIKNASVVAMAFDIPVSCVYIYIYIYSCRRPLEAHRYFSVRVELI